MGTQHTNAYYLPIKVKINVIEEHSWGRLFHVSKLKKSAKMFRGRQSTELSNHFGFNKKEISKSWNKIQKISEQHNAAVRSYK